LPLAAGADKAKLRFFQSKTGWNHLQPVFCLYVQFPFSLPVTHAQVKLANVLVGLQRLHIPFQYDPPVFHDVHVIGDGQGDIGVLLDDEYGCALLLVDLFDDGKNLLHEQRSQTQ